MSRKNLDEALQRNDGDELVYLVGEKQKGFSTHRSVAMIEPMSGETQALPDAFERLPVSERQLFAQEVLRRSLPFDSGPLSDDEISAASHAPFQRPSEDDGGYGCGEGAG